MPATTFPRFYRPTPASLPLPRHILTLALDKLHPVLRIAHASLLSLDIPSRIIFDFELVLVLEGAGAFVMGNRSYAYEPFSLFFIPPFVPHHFTAASGRGRHLAFHFDLAARFPSGSRLTTRRPYEVRLTNGLVCPTYTQLSRGHLLIPLFESVLEAWNHGSLLAPVEITTDLLRILTHLLRLAPAHAATERTRARLDRATQHIDANLAARHTVESLAVIADMSASHFAATFRRHVGHPPLEYLRRRRINQARRLLANIDLSIKEIAHQVGFPDAYHFSRVFRQLDGLSPSHYRSALLASHRPPIYLPSEE